MSKDTLCWYCKNASGNCPWSNGTFTPVEGWVVDNSKKISGISEQSYTVIECPMYREFYRRLKTEDIAKMLNMSQRSLTKLKSFEIKRRCLQLGKVVYIVKANDRQRIYYIMNKNERVVQEERQL